MLPKKLPTSVVFISMMVLTIIMASVIHVIINMSAYYNEKASAFRYHADQYTELFRTFVGTDDPDVAKQKVESLLAVLDENTYVKCIASGQVLWECKKEIFIDDEREYLEEHGTHIRGPNSYFITYTKYNRPPVLTYLKNSWTGSIVDLWNDPRMWQEKRLFERSKPLLKSFGIAVVFSALVWAFIRSREKESARRDAEHKQKEDELLRFKLFYENIVGQVNSTISEQKHNVQGLHMTWQETLGSIVHDIKNQVALDISCNVSTAHIENVDKNLGEVVYDGIIKPYNDLIMAELREIPKFIDFSVREHPLHDVVNSVKEIAGRNSPSVTITFHDEVQGKPGVVAVNLRASKSCLENLASNSRKAISRRKSIARKSKEAFYGKIKITAYAELVDRNALIIKVEDNAGGFDADIVGRVYHEPVMSSDKNTSRYGSGTSYVGTFMELMGGHIIAENITHEDGSVGACTRLIFPLCNGGRECV